MALKLFPPCRVRIERPDMAILKISGRTALLHSSFLLPAQIVMNTDNLVVGAFLSVGMVAFYSIGGSLMAYSWQVVGAISTTFTPLASGLEARGQLRSDFSASCSEGRRLRLELRCRLVSHWCCAGKTFIGLWMGPQYREISGTVLQILLVSQFFGIANGTPGLHHDGDRQA